MIMKLQGVIRLIAVCPLLLSLGMPIAYGQPVADKPGLQENPYQEFSLGAIKPAGWLEEMLVRQKEGLSGNLDRLYPLVMGPTNGWLGGDGDQWERGPYWIDGVLPLAYILDDAELIAKVKPWIEWTLASQKENGYFGPDTDYENTIVGIQRNNCGDWWPKMVMLKVMQQYYSATGDKRVIDFMTKYFQYQLKTLPVYPLDHWTFWARYRGGDNLMSVYWLYNITGDDFLLDLGEIIYSQTFPFTQIFTSHNWWHTGSMHCVNLAHGMKTPLIYYQRHPEQKYVDAAKQGLKDINTFISGPHGVIIGDEALHGNNPTQGSELCTAVEMMFSLENMLQIAGDPDYASQIERIAFNALPTQISDNFMTRQYFQQINQVEISMCDRNFDTNHHGTTTCFGLLSGYPCCTSNMHQGWPKFVQNLFYKTNDGGIAALLYSPSQVKTEINGQQILIKEKTVYPFEETVRFQIYTDNPVCFPFHLRIPEWCTAPELHVNGKSIKLDKIKNGIAVIKRTWRNDDLVVLKLPMKIRLTEWYERSQSVERGPLVYALRLEEKWQWNDNVPANGRLDKGFWEVHTTSPWNYALIARDPAKMEEHYRVAVRTDVTSYPWNISGAPLEIRTKGKKIPDWNIYNGSAGPLPYSIPAGREIKTSEEDIMLIPYGCTTLRIAEFPILGKYVIK